MSVCAPALVGRLPFAARVVCTGVAVLSAVSSPAAAGAAWSVPTTVPTSAGVTSPGPTLAFTASGDSVVTWRAGLQKPDESQRAFRVHRGRSGNFGTVVKIDGLAAAPLAFANTRVATLRTRGRYGHTRLVADLGTLTSTSGPDRTLAQDASLGAYPVLGGNLHGDLAAVWSQSVGDHDHLELSLRHPGGRFGPAHALRGSGRLAFPAVAYGDRGDTVVAYQRQFVEGGRTRFSVEARLRRAHHHFGSVRVLGSSRGVASIAVTIAPTGRAYVLWTEQDGGEEANQPLTVNATVAGPSHFQFNRARRIAQSAVRARQQGAPRLIVDRAGNATAAWSRPVGAQRTQVEAATATAGHRFSTPVAVLADAILQDLAGTPGGDALLVWTGAFGSTFAPRPVRASYRSGAGGAFTAPEDIVPAPEDPGGAAAAFDAGGLPVVTWLGRPGYLGEFPPAESRFVRLGVRTP